MAELNAVLSDGYDREAFARALARQPALQEVRGRLGRLLPHPEPLLCDLFCTLFKLNVVLLPAKTLPPSALINRRVLDVVLRSPGLEGLRRRTELDPALAANATVLLAERILDALRHEFRDRPGDLLHAAESAQDEALLEQRRAEARALEETSALEGESREAVAAELDEEIGELEARLGRNRRRQQAAARAAAGIGESVGDDLERLPARLDEAETQARGLGVGTGGDVDAGRRLELGERIMRSRKLQLLARLVGAFREAAFEARRRHVARSPQELHAVTLGAELERLLPAELLGLRIGAREGAGRGLHRDFLRRLAEGQVLQYRLDAPAERGPMVVCVDGSGSMQGAKELWAKAVALTLVEIARRERRPCLAVVFSSGEPLFELDLLARPRRGGRGPAADEAVLRFAEHFPGGGTDFEPPLARALEAVTGDERYRRGDVVFITDGHAPVSDALVRRIERARRRHRFKIRALLVDVGDHERGAVERFADDVRPVTDLTADSLADMFAAV